MAEKQTTADVALLTRLIAQQLELSQEAQRQGQLREERLAALVERVLTRPPTAAAAAEAGAAAAADAGAAAAADAGAAAAAESGAAAAADAGAATAADAGAATAADPGAASAAEAGATAVAANDTGAVSGTAAAAPCRKRTKERSEYLEIDPPISI